MTAVNDDKAQETEIDSESSYRTTYEVVQTKFCLLLACQKGLRARMVLLQLQTRRLTALLAVTAVEVISHFRLLFLFLLREPHQYIPLRMTVRVASYIDVKLGK